MRHFPGTLEPNKNIGLNNCSGHPYNAQSTPFTTYSLISWISQFTSCHMCICSLILVGKNKRVAMRSNWRWMIINGIRVHSSSVHSYRWTTLSCSKVVFISKCEVFWEVGNPIIVGPADGPLFSPGVHQDQTSKIQEQIPTFKLSVVDARLLFSCQIAHVKSDSADPYINFIILANCSSL